MTRVRITPLQQGEDRVTDHDSHAEAATTLVSARRFSAAVTLIMAVVSRTHRLPLWCEIVLPKIPVEQAPDRNQDQAIF